MTEFMSFLQNHLLLSILFIFLLAAAFALEFNLSQSKENVSVAKAIDLINHHAGVIFDFRSNAEYNSGNIVNSLNLGVSDLVASNKKLAKYQTKPVIVICAIKTKAKVLAQLKKIGFKHVFNMQGGIQAWCSANMPLVNKLKN